MTFTDAAPVTTVQTITTPDGKWVFTVSSTTSTIVDVEVSSPDGATIASDSGATLYDDHSNQWSVIKGVIHLNGAALAGTNNVTKLVFSKGTIYQENAGGLWWYWDPTNEIWVTTPLAPA